eukprot:4478550-Pyramimonas_sp.AAC.1
MSKGEVAAESWIAESLFREKLTQTATAGKMDTGWKQRGTVWSPMENTFYRAGSWPQTTRN